jgi:hypothetical protein
MFSTKIIAGTAYAVVTDLGPQCLQHLTEVVSLNYLAEKLHGLAGAFQSKAGLTISGLKFAAIGSAS